MMRLVFSAVSFFIRDDSGHRCRGRPTCLPAYPSPEKLLAKTPASCNRKQIRSAPRYNAGIAVTIGCTNPQFAYKKKGYKRYIRHRMQRL